MRAWGGKRRRSLLTTKRGRNKAHPTSKNLHGIETTGEKEISFPLQPTASLMRRKKRGKMGDKIFLFL